jgi:hypothetical protein
VLGAWRVLVVSAAVVLFGGLVLDAWTHRYRPASDAGHALLVVGATVLVLGAALLLLAPLLGSHVGTPAWRFAQVAVPVVAVGLLGPALVATASATTRHAGDTASAAAGHDHGLAVLEDTDHSHDAAVPTGATPTSAAESTGQSPAAQSPVAQSPATSGLAAPVAPGDPDGLVLAGEITGNSAGLHDHGHGSAVVPDQPLDDQTRALLGQQLEIARATALAYPTVADAERAGYLEVTPFVPLIGAHYLNPLKVDTTFDPSQPEMLLYDGTEPSSKIVGLSYFVSSPGGEPAGFAGPNDHWHQHIGLCIRGHRVVGGEKLTREQCLARGGNKVALRDIWMVHVWVVPGWESPKGSSHPSIRTCSSPTETPADERRAPIRGCLPAPRRTS